MKKIFMLLTALLMLSGCAAQEPTAESVPETQAVTLAAEVTHETVPPTEETTLPDQPQLPWDPEARWYATYYFDKRPNPDPNIVEGVVRFNALLRNPGKETLTILSAHGDFYQGTQLVAQEDFPSSRLPDFLPHPGVGNLELKYGEGKVFQLYAAQEPGTYDRAVITYTLRDPDGAESVQTFYFAVNPEDVTPYSTSHRTDWSGAAWSETRWDFYLLPRNDTDRALEFVGIYSITFRDGLPMGADFFDRTTVNPQALKDIQTLLPGEMAYYQTGITHQFNTSDQQELTMVYKDAAGELYLQTFCFALDQEHAIPGAVSIYRSVYADYGVSLLDTPEKLAQELGAPQYTRQEIREFINSGLTPEELAKKLSTISDVQLYLLEAGIEFSGGDIKQSVDGILWHFNDSPAVVIRQNYGNCGSGSSLINFLLQGDYQEQGYFNWSGTKAGHIFNYFRSGDRYYIFDWANKCQDCFAVFAADSLEDFSEAYIRVNHAVNAPQKAQHILLMYAYPYEGYPRPMGDGDVRTSAGVPLMCRLPAELERSVRVYYLAEEQYAPVFADAPPVSQWPGDAR